MSVETGSDAAARRSIYFGKIMVAPMVRVSSLAFRVFCAQHGADVVFSEEVVAIKLAKAVREVVEYRGAPGRPVVEFVVYEPFKNMSKRAVVFATFQKSSATDFPEGAPVVLQLGAADPAVAARAAALVCDDVDGIDVNMGCPKKFSVDNGMGAALMSDPERAAAILVAIDAEVNSTAAIARRNGRRVPISFKTRVFETIERSVEQLSAIFDTGVPHALSLHARTREQRSETPARYEFAQQLAAALREKYGKRCPCLVLNGSVEGRDDATDKMRRYGFDGALLARSAMWDPSVFSSRVGSGGGAEHTPFTEAVSMEVGGARAVALFLRLLYLMRDLQTHVVYTKYHLTRSFQEFPFAKGKDGLHHRLQMSRGYVQLAEALGLEPEAAERDFGDIEELMENIALSQTRPTGVEDGACEGDQLAEKRPRLDVAVCTGTNGH